MEPFKTPQFLQCFPNHVFRMLDETGGKRPPAMAQKYPKDLNHAGYGAYFTVNGFANFEADQDCKSEHMTNLNSFFVDIDGRKDYAEIEAIKQRLHPTFVVETMRGYHLYWLLDEEIYKNEVTPEEWAQAVSTWERIEQAIVTQLSGDPVVKDATRILRVPGTYYWKKSGDAYKEGVAKAPFRIKLIESNIAYRYSMDQMLEAFPVTMVQITEGLDQPNIAQKKSQMEKDDFFRRVDEKFPIDERPSFVALLSGDPKSLPAGASRNNALLILSTLARRAGWTEKELFTEVKNSGWHGMTKEKGGENEIKTTINSAYKGGYIYGKKNPIIEHNMTDEERSKLDMAYVAVVKDRKEQDKLRFSTYEQEIVAQYPNLKKNEAGIFFNYFDGVYKMMTDNDMKKLVLDCMYEDMLWGYRTSRSVSDKMMCLLAIIPEIVESSDGGKIINVRNGLLNILTRELKPHTPEFVSLVQLPVEYSPEAQCPTWTTALLSWTEGDEQSEKSQILQQFAGYCLSSSTRYAKALFLIGDGGNGKSTYADTIAMLVGREGTSRIKLESIHKDFGLAGLIGKRLNIIEEISANYFHSDVIKALISGEEVTTEMKYKSQFKFKPQAKFIFAVNQMPRVDDASSGMERRILAVNFNNNFRNNPNVDLRFSDGLLSKELSGILNWALEGAKSLSQNKGFNDTKERKEVIQSYREENSSVDGFLAECTVEKEGNTMSTRDLYEVYREFCKSDGRNSKSHVSFTKEIKMHANKTGKISFVPRKNGKGVAEVEGVDLAVGWEKNFVSSYVPREF